MDSRLSVFKEPPSRRKKTEKPASDLRAQLRANETLSVREADNRAWRTTGSPVMTLRYSSQMHFFVSGTGFSGSGFLLDFLREQHTVDVLPFRPFNYKSTGLKIGHQVFDLFLEQDSYASRLRALEIVSQLESSLQKIGKQGKRAQLAADPVSALLRARRFARRRLSAALRSKRTNPETKSVSQPLFEAEHDVAAFRKLATPPSPTRRLAFQRDWPCKPGFRLKSAETPGPGLTA